LADAIQKGLAAKAAGDDALRPFCSARPPRSPTTAGTRTHTAVAKVVDVVDADTGTVRLKGNVERTDEMALDTRSTKTTRIRKEA
jgi:endonuclease YncB( thermonuclease family)